MYALVADCIDIPRENEVARYRFLRERARHFQALIFTRFRPSFYYRRLSAAFL
jgi:hypothetical protein